MTDFLVAVYVGVMAGVVIALVQYRRTTRRLDEDFALKLAFLCITYAAERKLRDDALSVRLFGAGLLWVVHEHKKHRAQLWSVQ